MAILTQNCSKWLKSTSAAYYHSFVSSETMQPCSTGSYRYVDPQQGVLFTCPCRAAVFFNGSCWARYICKLSLNHLRSLFFVLDEGICPVNFYVRAKIYGCVSYGFLTTILDACGNNLAVQVYPYRKSPIVLQDHMDIRGPATTPLSAAYWFFLPGLKQYNRFHRWHTYVDLK